MQCNEQIMHIEELQSRFPNVEGSLLAALVADYDKDDEDSLLSVLESLNFEAAVNNAQTESTPFAEINPHLQVLRESFPSVSDFILNHKLEEYNGDVDRAIDDLLNFVALDGRSQLEGQDFSLFKKKKKRNKNAAIVELLDHHHEAEAVASRPTRASIHSIDDPPTYASVAHSSDDSTSDVSRSITSLDMAIDEYTTQAGQLKTKANEMFIKSKSNHLLRSAAGVYSERADEVIKRRNVLLTDKFRQVARAQATPYSVDFHGVPLDVALDLCPQELHNWWTREMHSGHSPRPFRIITGKGLHSDQGIPKIKNNIRRILTTDWVFQEYSAHFEVHRPKCM